MTQCNEMGAIERGLHAMLARYEQVRDDERRAFAAAGEDEGRIPWALSVHEEAAAVRALTIARVEDLAEVWEAAANGRSTPRASRRLWARNARAARREVAKGRAEAEFAAARARIFAMGADGEAIA